MRLYRKTLVIDKNEVKHWVHGRMGGPQVLSVKVSHRTSGDLDLVVSVASQVGGYIEKTLIYGEWGLEK